MTDDQATRIHERIDGLSATVGELSTTIKAQGVRADARQDQTEQRCTGHSKKLGDIQLILNGPPENSKKPGLRTRVDRLEGLAQRLDRYGRALWGMALGIVGLIAKAIWSLINGG